MAELLQEERELIESHLPAWNVYKHPFRQRKKRHVKPRELPATTFEAWVSSWRADTGTGVFGEQSSIR